MSRIRSDIQSTALVTSRHVTRLSYVFIEHRPTQVSIASFLLRYPSGAVGRRHVFGRE